MERLYFILGIVCPGILLLVAVVFGLLTMGMARADARATRRGERFDWDRNFALAVCSGVAVLSLLASLIMAVVMALI